MSWRSHPITSLFSTFVAEGHDAAEHVSGSPRVRVVVKTTSGAIDVSITAEAAEEYADALRYAARRARREIG